MLTRTIMYIHVTSIHTTLSTCVEHGMSRVRIPPKAAQFFSLKITGSFGCMHLLCITIHVKLYKYMYVVNGTPTVHVSAHRKLLTVVSHTELMSVGVGWIAATSTVGTYRSADNKEQVYTTVDIV